MSTAAINPKGPRVYAPGNTPSAWAGTYLTSTVGQKILVGLTGILLVGFLVFHMIGNLKVLPGFEEPSEKAKAHAAERAVEKWKSEPELQQRYRVMDDYKSAFVAERARAFEAQEHLNAYAAFLKHNLGALIWIARGGLLLLFVTHLVVAIRLRLKAGEARPVGYVTQRTAQASVAAKTMLWTGVVILLFTVFHLAHYTAGWIKPAQTPNGPVHYLDLKDPDGRHDAYSMVIAGFTTPWVSVLYIVTQAILLVHLSHGIQSSLQTLGLVGKRFTPAAKLLGWGIASTIFFGNLVIVMSVWLGWAKPVL
ncbi:MAG: succinate dehydrogenase cytochrome b subunit [Fimbriiglobus sp.]|jgi:succinate dehydrogenase / fumarate reductase cytochrome b subunit|nr:succinate dehydrogenase cytochrome b subunit [Fimbriiglobus sp.]